MNNKKLMAIVISSILSISSIQAEKQNIPFEDLKKFSDTYQLIKQHYVEPIEGKTLIDYAIQGMVNKLDPHSKYLNESEQRSLKDSIQGNYAGLGIEILETEQGIKVITPFDDSPAKKVDIRANDLIIKIDSKYVSTFKNINEAIKKLRGKEGTSVKLTIKREDEILEKELIREKIKIKSVSSKILENHYGYVRIASFQEPTAKNLKEEIEKLNNENLHGLIIDLRNNPGGLLNSAVDIVDMFIDGKEISVSVKGREGKGKNYYTKEGDILSGKPIVVLINEGSASASEIVSGALQDLNRAIIIGKTSFGKGSVQEIIPFEDNTTIKFTTSRYYTPNGTSIQATGIVPDIELDNVKIEPIQIVKVQEKDLSGHIVNDSTKETEEIKHFSITEDYFIKSALDSLKVINLINKK